MDAPGAAGPGRKELKIVIVGDGGCGKTSLLMVYSQGSFPERYAPSVFEKYTASVTVGSKEVTLNLYDTAASRAGGSASARPLTPSAVWDRRPPGQTSCSLHTLAALMHGVHWLVTTLGGQEDYDRLRPLSYQNTHLVLICYDVMNPTSFDNVLIKWFPEVTHFCRGTPMVLIGCKTDLRKDKEQLRKLRAAQLEPVTYTQGQSACEQIRAALYLECSAKFRENVEEVFREAARVALRALKKNQKQHRLCLLL
ncbi:rho-related GTP-binding protein RhoF isoform X1 [Choloepus didactylus]|uniref:rho-related GTP-binding protein RhoF isoform X1 n=1 Tax=Choloepus didactylus TaxID=27675 RepID=UPI0018A0F0C7|nr:rho-related GTP-binding protein RhoF isoform X1 [Choloepus didactylus]